MPKWMIVVVLLSLLPRVGAQDQNLVELVQSDGRFGFLADGIGRVAGFTELLSGPEKEYTVFAPTDDAFVAIIESLDPLYTTPGALESVLSYHVVEGKFTFADLKEVETLTTVLGAPLSVEVLESGLIKLNDTAIISQADVEASNGIIHVIDAVLIPERPQNTSTTVADVIANRADLAFLNTALGLAPLLQQVLSLPQNADSNFHLVLLAPTDEAFTALDDSLRTAAIADPTLLGSILLHHLGTVEATNAEEALAILQDSDFVAETLVLDGLETDVVTLSFDNEGKMVFNESAIALEFIPADNGIVVVIDQVLIPAEEAILSDEAYAELLQTFQTLIDEAGVGGVNDESKANFAEGPALDPNWDAVAGGFGMSELDSADDFFVTVLDPFTSGDEAELYGVEIINWTAEYQYTGFIVEQFLPAEVLIWMAEQDPAVWENISVATLQLLPVEELAKLPEDVQVRAQ